MGYRSEVCIKFSEQAADVLTTACKMNKHLKELVESADQGSIEDHFLYFEYSKWYDSYPEVEAIESILTELDEYDYGFIRIGEEYEDVEERGEPWEYDLSVQRSLSW